MLTLQEEQEEDENIRGPVSSVVLSAAEAVRGRDSVSGKGKEGKEGHGSVFGQEDEGRGSVSKKETSVSGKPAVLGTCARCFSVLEHARMLNCLHVFCGTCTDSLVSHAENQSLTGNSVSHGGIQRSNQPLEILCPACHAPTRLSARPSRPQSRPINTLEPDTHTKSRPVNTLELDVTPVLGKLRWVLSADATPCDNCESDPSGGPASFRETRNPATRWCETCQASASHPESQTLHTS